MAYFLEVGLLLVFAPWSTFWEHNYFSQLVPAIGWATGSCFVRGAVSGLGLITLAAGAAELFSVFPSRRR